MKTIIFDVDGTMLNTKAGIIAGINYTLRCHGRQPIATGEEDKYVGPSVYDCFVNFHGFAADEAAVATDEYRSKYVAEFCLDSTPYDGLLEVLHLIKSKGYRLCIATMKTSRQVFKLIDHFGLNGLFDMVEYAREEGGYTKAEMLKSIMAQYSTGDYLFIGDTKGDYKAAVEAEMPFVYARYGYGELEGYDGMAISSLGELEQYL